MAHRIIYKPSGIILSSTLGDIAIAVEGDYVDVLQTTTSIINGYLQFYNQTNNKTYGSILHLRNCISLRYNFYGGWRNVKILSSGELKIAELI